MAFREVTVFEIKEVLRLWRRGVAKKRIAAQLGVDVKTVRGYVKGGPEAAAGSGAGSGRGDDGGGGTDGGRESPSARARLGKCAQRTLTSSDRSSKTGYG
jgi:hypothetical protein